MINSKKILIVGFGSIGKKHANLIKKNWPSFNISVLKNSSTSNALLKDPISHFFESIIQAVEWKPDCAIISSPCTFHLEQALFLAKNNIPILIEKPVGDGNESPKSWQNLIELSTTVPIMVGYVFRHDDCFKKMKEFIKNLKFGKLIEIDSYCGSWLPDWRQNIDYKESVSAKKNLGGGVLLELSHDLDIVNNFFGPITIDHCSKFNTNLLDIDVEDYALIHGRSEFCDSISVRLNFCTQPEERFLKIRYSEGQLFWNLVEGFISTKSSIGEENILYKSNFGKEHKFFMQLKNFFEFAFKNEKTLCSLEDGLKVLNLINSAKKYSFSKK